MKPTKFYWAITRKLTDLKQFLVVALLIKIFSLNIQILWVFFLIQVVFKLQDQISKIQRHNNLKYIDYYSCICQIHLLSWSAEIQQPFQDMLAFVTTV